MSDRGFPIRITPKGRELSKKVMIDHVTSLSNAEFAAISRGREPTRRFSSLDIALVLSCYAAAQLESHDQGWLKGKLNEILAKVYEP